MVDYKYGVVIDSGLSGSRVMVYRWIDALTVTQVGSSEIPDRFYEGLPLISLEDGWTTKITPGVSTFGTKPSKLWKSHYQKLIEFAEKIVPTAQIPDTPIYVLSTAGMRLLPEKQRSEVLKMTCKLIQRNSRFHLPDCSEHVRVIDGPTEGIYGWLALNYLMGLFNGITNEGERAESIGFLDMGGASTQIAFVPSAEEISKHDEDLATVILRKNNGDSQTWRVFVETWLGFGANQARSRHLNALIHLHIGSNQASKKRLVKDPCMPTGALLKNYEYNGQKYSIQGTGNYEQCLRETYPLLMKHLPCKDDPCLFNGIHAPKMDFEKDKFVGISEYWYSANDIFHSGGEYNFHTFNEKVKAFCDSNWDTVKKNSLDGAYLNLPESALLDACFKATWVLNVLHEGFGLPRLNIDINNWGDTETDREVEKIHVPFKSAQSVQGKELSWTLGKMLLVASSQIPGNDGTTVGITGKSLVDIEYDSDDERMEHSLSIFWWGALAFMVLLIWARIERRRLRKFFNDYSKLTPRKVLDVKPKVKNVLSSLRKNTPEFFRPLISRVINYMEIQQQIDFDTRLEEGTSRMSPRIAPQQSVLRTRSSINLASDASPLPLGTPEFMNKPFMNPKIASSIYQL